jgi:hypothetical protein
MLSTHVDEVNGRCSRGILSHPLKHKLVRCLNIHLSPDINSDENYESCAKEYLHLLLSLGINQCTENLKFTCTEFLNYEILVQGFLGPF